MISTEFKIDDYYNECFKTIKANIKYSSLLNKNKVILIASSNEGVGCTTISIKLSEAFSEDKKVLLIDANFRNPSLDKIFKYDKDIGLNNVLFNEIKVESAIYKYNNKLHLLFTGHKSLKPCDILDSEQMKNLIDLLRDRYDYIFIDSTPLGVFADTQYLIPKVDSIIMVLNDKKTKKQDLKYAKQIIDQTRGSILGVIVNKSKNVKASISNYY